MAAAPCPRPPGGARRRRALAFRAVAVLLGLAPLAALELILAACGWGDPDLAQDPFVGFSAQRPLFTANPADGVYAIPPSRQLFFRPETFALDKPPGEFRIFCLGGSTVQGRPFAVETSFTTWLELALQAADPRRQWEAVNCGGVSYASYRLAPILQEVLGYQPDLIVLYTGHNEFLEDRTYRHIKDAPRLLRRSQELAGRLRTFVLLREAWLWLHGRSTRRLLRDRPVLSHEADAILEYRNGLAQYHRDDGWRRDVVTHYAFNIRRMIRMAQQAGVPMILVDPVANLRDCPPFKSEHRAGLSEDAKNRFRDLLRLAQRRLSQDPQAAWKLVEQALAIDDQYALAVYEAGRCWDAMGRPDRAREAYRRANELDVCPLRMIEPLHAALRQAAEEAGAPLVDARGEIARRCPDGIPDATLMVDHVHPSIRGHQLIANLLVREIIREGWARPVAGWERRRDRAYARHMASLDNAYYLEAEARWGALRNWAAGRGTKEPAREAAE